MTKRHVEPPHPIAAIDVGATSIRMCVAEVNARGEVRRLDELVHPVSLGDDTFRVGRIRPPTMRAVCQVLKNFARIAAEYGVATPAAYATSAMRDASNQDIVADRICHESGIQLKVLDAVEESRLTYQSALPFLRARLAGRRRHTLLIDLGGGSTEIMVLRGANLLFAGTRRLGVARVFHMHGVEHASDRQSMLASIIRNIIDSVEDLYRSFPIQDCVVINSLLTQAFGDEPGVECLADGLIVPREILLQAAGEVEDLSTEKRAERFHIGCADGEMILSALLILKEFIEGVSVERVHFANVDMMSGLLEDQEKRLRGLDPLESFRQQIINSALGIAKRYHSNLPHAEQVARLADRLFEELKGFLDLTQQDRLYLHVAALLHDVGMFVSEMAHHKHSAYLVRHAEIVGLSDEDLALISQVVRYHRKAVPISSHIDFMAFPAPERLRIIKLAALLRIADALDRRHGSGVRSLRTALTEEELLITVECTGDLIVETAALSNKGNLFEEITGLRLALRRS